VTVDGDRVRRALLRPPDVAVLVDVGPAPGGVDLIVSSSTALSSPSVAAVEADVARWLGLSDDLSGFHARAAMDPPMAPVLEVARGLHQVRFPSLSEATVYFALTQRSTTWFARARKRRLAAAVGVAVVADGVTYPAFPSLATVAAMSVEEMIEFAGNRQRAERVLDVARGVAALDESWLRTAPYDEARRALLAISGVGPFTAHGLLIRALGRPDDVPLEMAQFTRAAAAVYGEPPPSPAELRERYGDQIGWWAYVTRTALAWLPEPAPAVTG
jgi:DNA-3-methyladenine glycosylase II